MTRRGKYKYSPSSEHIEGESGEAVSVENEKKATLLQKASTLFTILSTIYAIFSTALLIAKKWVSGVAVYVLVAMLCVYVIAFVVVAVYAFKHPKEGGARAKTYKKTLKAFKAVANLVFLVLTAVSLAGMANDMTPGKWIVFSFTLLVGVVKLVFSIVMLMMRLAVRHTAKHYVVHTQSFKDGKKMKRTASEKRQDKKYD